MYRDSDLSRRTIFSVCSLLMITGCFPSVGPATCLTSIAADLGMNEIDKGILLSLAFWSSAITVIISGPLADRFGFRIVLVSGTILQLCGLILASWSDDSAELFAAVLVIGSGRGLVIPLPTAIVSVLNPQRRTQAMNLLHGFYPVGVVLTIIIILTVLHFDCSWRDVFRVLALLVLPHGVIALLIRFPSPAAEKSNRVPLRWLLGNRTFAWLVAGAFVGGAIEIGLSTWLPNYIEKGAGGSKLMGGVSLILFAISMAAGRFFVSAMGHRLGPKLLFTAGAAICGSGVLLVLISPSLWLTMVCFSGIGFGAAELMPTVFASGGDRFPQAGVIMYSLLISSVMFGGAVGTFLIGWVAYSAGLRIGMSTLTVASILAIALMWQFHREQK